MLTLLTMLLAAWPQPSADFDNDGDIDMVDFGMLQRSYGPAMPWSRYDLDNSGMVDRNDIKVFQDMATGAR